jgi:hypothetical protein
MKYLFEGLQILMKYWPEATDANAEHEVIYLGGEKESMSSADADTLLAIPHWHYHRISMLLLHDVERAW